MHVGGLCFPDPGQDQPPDTQNHGSAKARPCEHPSGRQSVSARATPLDPADPPADSGKVTWDAKTAVSLLPAGTGTAPFAGATLGAKWDHAPWKGSHHAHGAPGSGKGPAPPGWLTPGQGPDARGSDGPVSERRRGEGPDTGRGAGKWRVRMRKVLGWEGVMDPERACDGQRKGLQRRPSPGQICGKRHSAGELKVLN